MTEDAPEMVSVVEDLGRDEGEGFPGGPRDPSVLTSFVDHVAHSIWNGEVFLIFKLFVNYLLLLNCL